MRRRIARVLLERAIQLLFGLSQITFAQIIDSEVQIDLRRAMRIGLRSRGRRGSRATGQRPHHGSYTDRCDPLHDCTATEMSLEPRRTVVLSLTRPTSWPQAASISSP